MPPLSLLCRNYMLNIMLDNADLKKLARKSTLHRDIWRAIYKSDIGEVRRLLEEAPRHIFTYIVGDVHFKNSKIAVI